jgi:hypothetical protein
MLAVWGCRLERQARIGYLDPRFSFAIRLMTAKAAERIRATSYPQANEFAAHNVLQPPSEKQMLEAFSKAELK